MQVLVRGVVKEYVFNSPSPHSLRGREREIKIRCIQKVVFSPFSLSGESEARGAKPLG